MDGKEASANYDKLGHKLATEIEIKESDLCKSVAYIQRRISNKKIKETAKITDNKM
jgi:hypothetical protein